MKNFIYYENGWRWFEAEQLPVKPIIDYRELIDSGHYYRGIEEEINKQYNSELSAIKDNSLPVHNNEICPQNMSFVVEGQCYEWPGSVEVKEAIKRTFITNGRADYNPIKQVAILKLTEVNH